MGYYKSRKPAPRRKTTRRTGRRPLGVTAPAFLNANGGVVKYRRAAPSMGRLRNVRRKFVGSGLRPRQGASRTTTLTKRRTVRDSAGYTQWDKSSYTKQFGRLTQAKLNRANTEVLDLVWKRVGRLDIGGQLFAGNWIDTSLGTHKAYRPIYLVDITSGVTAGATANPVSQVSRILGSGSNAIVVMDPISGITATDSLATPWQRAHQPSESTGVTPNLTNKSILKWTEFRFDLWGCKDHPVEWELTLCQLDHVIQVDPSIAGTSVTDRQGVDWWDQLSAKLCFSPSDRKAQNGIGKNMVKVLDRRSFIINPTSTTESDVDPHVRSVRLFYNMNRQVSFVWRNLAPNTLTSNVDPAQNPGWEPSVAADQYDTAEPKARVYMMITCKNWRTPPTSYAGMTTANTASFNMSVYNRWIV